MTTRIKDAKPELVVRLREQIKNEVRQANDNLIDAARKLAEAERRLLGLQDNVCPHPDLKRTDSGHDHGAYWETCADCGLDRRHDF